MAAGVIEAVMSPLMVRRERMRKAKRAAGEDSQSVRACNCLCLLE